ncbi:MAG: 5'-nucleotidase C-terminal domain-containing protein [Prevotella sp.]|nr:5'-nucleotidase C-terminal domain-containing protein [Prevotella sp.]
MKKKFLYLGFVAVLVLMASCAKHYQMESVSRSRMLIDSRYDAQPDAKAAAFLAPYKQTVDSVMGPVVGRAGSYLAAERPESKLSNLLADIMVWAGKRYGETVSFAVYNIGGIRASFAEGDVTIGDVLDVAPFENKICFFDMTGEKVRELFEQIAKRGGEGVSSGVRLRISADGRLLSALIDGKEVDPAATYRVTTLDYLAEGNDQMTAFKAKTNLNSPGGPKDNTRELIMDYFREQQKLGKVVDSQVEGRVVVEN